MSPPKLTGLDQPVTVPDLEWVNFFNGRLLTGGDLGREQSAGRIARQLFGRALGSGVAEGLEVGLAAGVGSAAVPVLDIGAGLAVNRRGDALELATSTQVELTVAPDTGATNGTGFAVCVPLAAGTYTAATGAFLLTIGPASAPTGRAAVSGLGNEGAACNVAFASEGVQFHLIRIALPTSLDGDPGRLRNRLAHLFLGTGDAIRVAGITDPLAGSDGRYGLLDLLPSGCLGEDRVPLALLHWTVAGVEFVDRWAVRRRIAAPPATAQFGVLLGDRRRAEAEATLLQFEDQLADLRAQLAAPEAAVAADHFAYLPAAGMLPAAVPGGPPGFAPAAFFGAQASSEVVPMEAAQVTPLINESQSHEPVAVGGPRRIQLYSILEQELALAAGQPVTPTVLFASETLPIRAGARFGRAMYGRSRLVPRIT